MIKEDFYPDYTTVIADLIRTDYVRGLNITTPACPADAYAMGALTANQSAPYVGKKFSASIGSGLSDTIVKLEKENATASWGFGFDISDYVTYYDADTGKWGGASGERINGNLAFLNSMRAYAYRFNANLALTFMFADTEDETLESGETVKVIITSGTWGSKTLYGTQVIDFFKNDVPIVLGEYSFKYSECLNGTHWDVGLSLIHISEPTRPY